MRASARSLIFATALVLTGTGLAAADVEPNDWLYQAEPAGATITGTIATQNEEDWYVFTAASQTQLQLTATSPSPNGCSNDIYTRLYDTDGDYIDDTYADVDTPGVITYTTPAGPNRMFLKITGSRCVGKSYRIDMTPAANITAGPAMPNPTTYNPEPNENDQQTAGPLSGDVTYRGTIDTENDQDWFYFNAGSAFDIIFTGVSTCSGEDDVDLYIGEDYIDGSYTSTNRLTHLTHTPNGWQQFRLKVTSTCVGVPYQFMITPGSALAPQLPLPAPATPPTTAPTTPPTTAPTTPPSAAPTTPSAECVKARSAKRAAKAKMKRLSQDLKSAKAKRAKKILRQKIRKQAKVVRFTTKRAAALC